MKKQNVSKLTVSILLVFVMILLMIPFSALPTAAVWDSSAAYDFASGSGTESDPYIINTAEQLAYFAEYVNNGYGYSYEYFKLGADIYLNNASFALDLDSGLVNVRYYDYGYRTAYLGTGILGDASGSNTTFDTIASEAGTWYSSPSSTATTTFSGTLNAWTPIGNSSYSFEGTFDGDGHTVYGLYIDTDQDQDYQGLFGYVENNATISNIGVENSYIRAGEYVGGVVGYVRAYGEGISATIENCYHKGVINGHYQVGGIAGYCSATDDNYSTASVTVKNCYNTGTIYSSSGSAGGVVGKNEYNGTVEECYNMGTILGKDYIGGVVGFNDAFSADRGTPTARNCYNTGTVKGVHTYNTYSEDIGGVVGRNENSIVDECYNTGNVSGYSAVGGVVGDNMQGSLVSNSHNTGKVTGFENAIGGVAGLVRAPITNCYNTGDVALVGEFSDNTSDYSLNAGLVGGIVGEAFVNSSSYALTIERCYNTGSISGSVRVGGILGGFRDSNHYSYKYGYNITIAKCYNMGAVSGEFYVGGIAGSFGEYGSKFENSYNAGAVSGNSSVGGLIGRSYGYGYPQKSYNVGTVTGSDNVDAITSSKYANNTNVYYLDTGVTITSSVALTDAQMRYSSSFAGFDFDTVWEIGEACRYSYPVLRGVALANDEHTYDGNCDDMCNSCGYERTAPHNRDSEAADCVISACVDCGAEMPAIAAHVRNSEYADCIVAPCTVCGANVEATAEHYVNVSTTETVTVISLQNSNTYPFSLSSGRYTSTNKADSSSSTFTITALYDCSVTIKYGVSSESNYDWLTIYKNTSQLNRISGTVSDQTLTIELLSGEYINITYSKDGSVNNGSDSGYFEIISDSTIEITTIEQVPAASQTATCANPVICDGCGVTVKEGHDYSTKWTVDKEATCDTNGSKSHHCKICGAKTDVTVIPMLGHTEVTDAAVDPNCTETGLTEGKHCSICSKVLVAQQTVPALGHDYKATVTKPNCTEAGYTTYTCDCGDSYVADEVDALGHDYTAQGNCSVCGVYRATFSGASLTLEDNIAINFKVTPEQFEGTEYSDPYVVFTFNGEQYTVTEYTIDAKGRYAFAFTDIAPRMMNDTIVATLYATYEGEQVVCQSRSYSVKEYCYNMLARCNAGGVYENNEKFKALLVDLLNYGEAAQIYGNYNVDTLVTADLTDTQKSWATDATPSVSTVQNLRYKTIKDPAVGWQAGGLLLEDAVTMRFKFSVDSIEDVTVKFYTDSNPTGWVVGADELVETTGGYYVYFDGLKARQMRESVYITVYRGDTAISNTVRYSIESYAYAKRNDSNAKLTALLEAMMKYGDSAYKYINE